MKTKEQSLNEARKSALERKGRDLDIRIHNEMVIMQDELERQDDGSAADINLDRIAESVQRVRRMQRELEETLLKLAAYEG